MRPLPRRPAIAIRNPRAAPAQADQALRIAEFAVQVAAPDRPGVIVGDDLFPTGVAEQPVFDIGRPAVPERLALKVLAAGDQQGTVLAGRRPGAARAQGASDAAPVERVGDHAGQAAVHPEHLHARRPAARTAAVFIPARRHADAIAAPDHVLVEPAEMAP